MLEEGSGVGLSECSNQVFKVIKLVQEGCTALVVVSILYQDVGRAKFRFGEMLGVFTDV